MLSFQGGEVGLREILDFRRHRGAVGAGLFGTEPGLPQGLRQRLHLLRKRQVPVMQGPQHHLQRANGVQRVVEGKAVESPRRHRVLPNDRMVEPVVVGAEGTPSSSLFLGTSGGRFGGRPPKVVAT